MISGPVKKLNMALGCRNVVRRKRREGRGGREMSDGVEMRLVGGLFGG